MLRLATTGIILALLTAAHAIAQQAAGPAQPAAPAATATAPAAPVLRIVSVTPIPPPTRSLPPEAESADVSRFSFIAYGDTRGGAQLGNVIHPIHSVLADVMVAKARELETTAFPVRFVLNSGDAVLQGHIGEQWNTQFSPIVAKLARAGLPYLFVPGNHDIGSRPVGTPTHALGLQNTLTAISRLIPPEGSPRRLAGYGTYTVGYGNVFLVGLDSNIAEDELQLLWVRTQLEQLDRSRYRHVIAWFHHPPYSSGNHGAANVEPPTAAIRRHYMPLFRRHNLRMVISGHEHLFEHWAERYTDNGTRHRLDVVVSGGGGAPTYFYRGEPDLTAYRQAAGDAAALEVEHIVAPAPRSFMNPHHFVIVRVDGDALSLEIVAIGPDAFTPYGDDASAELTDRPESR